MRVANVVTSFTSLTTAILCGAIALQAGLVAAGHVQSGDPTMGVLPLGTTILGLYLTLVMGVPAIRDRLLSFGATPLGRAVLGVPALGILILIVLRSLRFSDTEYAEALMAAVPPVVLAAIMAGFAVAYIATFLLPGLAYDKFRKGPAKQVAQAAASAARRRGPTFRPAGELDGGPAQPEKRYLKLQSGDGTGRGAAQRQRSAGTDAKPRGTAIRLARGANLVLLLMLVGLWAYGTSWARFLPTPEHLAHINANKNALIAGTCGALALLALLTPLPEGPGLFRFALIRRTAFAAFCAFFGLMAPAALSTGLPALTAQVFPSSAASLNVRVLERGVQMRTRACDRAAIVAWPDTRGYAQQLCSLPPEVWADLRPGDTLELTGRMTDFGFSYGTAKIAGR